MKKYSKFLAMISSEFHRYLMENGDFADQLPTNALVIFQIEGEEDFNLWHREMSLRNKDKDQQVRYVMLKKWRQHSAIEDVALVAATA